jgi:hypothetical protein
MRLRSDHERITSRRCPGSPSPVRTQSHAMSAVHFAMGTIRFDPTLERIGPSPDALLSHYAIVGGDVRGPGLAALTVQSGSEWTSLGGDGIASVDARHTLRTASNGLIFASLTGIYDLGDRAYEDVLMGERLHGFRRAELSLRYQTDEPEYRWLNRLQCIAIGKRDFKRSRLTIDIYHFDENVALAHPI